jgi:hypothetical protein
MKQKHLLTCSALKDGTQLGCNLPIPEFVEFKDMDNPLIFCPLCPLEVGKTLLNKSWKNEMCMLMHLTYEHSEQEQEDHGWTFEHLRGLLREKSHFAGYLKHWKPDDSNVNKFTFDHTNQQVWYLYYHPLLTDKVIDRLPVHQDWITKYTDHSPTYNNNNVNELDVANYQRHTQMAIPGLKGIDVFDEILTQAAFITLPTGFSFFTNSNDPNKFILSDQKRSQRFSFMAYTIDYLQEYDVANNVIFNFKQQVYRQGILPVLKIVRDSQGMYFVIYPELGKDLGQYMREPQAWTVRADVTADRWLFQKNFQRAMIIDVVMGVANAFELNLLNGNICLETIHLHAKYDICFQSGWMFCKEGEEVEM